MVMMQKSLSASMNARMIGAGGSTGNNKETIVLAHGYGGDHTVWDKVLSSFAQSYQVLVFDWCFSGAVNNNNQKQEQEQEQEQQTSSFDEEKYSCYDAFADDLIALVEEMELKSSVFVGHSMSGIIGCIASVKRPDLFKTLVLVSSSPRFINSEDYEGGFEMSEIEQLFKNIETNYDQWTSDFATAVVDGNDPISVEHFDKSLKRMGREVALPLAKTVFLGDYRSILENVKIPCTIVKTLNDAAVPDFVSAYMQKTIAGKTTVEIIETQGHFPQLTAPNLFLQVLHRVFLNL